MRGEQEKPGFPRLTAGQTVGSLPLRRLLRRLESGGTTDLRVRHVDSRVFVSAGDAVVAEAMPGGIKEPQLIPHRDDAPLGGVGELEAVCARGSGGSMGLGFLGGSARRRRQFPCGFCPPASPSWPRSLQRRHGVWEEHQEPSDCKIQGRIIWAGLVKKENLNKLTLWWNHLNQSIDNTDHEGVFQGLRPNSNLRKLCVKGYMGIDSPSWLSCKYLPNIHSIELLRCYHWKTLPPFGSLPFLRILKIRHLTMVETIDAGFYGDASVVFPSLEELLFEGMTQWKVWSAIESSQQVFPRLLDICIRNCTQLMGPLPLPLFNQMQISVSDLTSEKVTSCEPEDRADVSKSYRVQLSLDRLGLLFGCLPTSSLTTVHMLDISSYYLKAFNMDQEEWLQQLASLKELRFSGCLKLKSLPSNKIRLTSLEFLYIEICPKLESFPQMGLPLSLKKLTLMIWFLAARKLRKVPVLEGQMIEQRLDSAVCSNTLLCCIEKNQEQSRRLWTITHGILMLWDPLVFRPFTKTHILYQSSANTVGSSTPEKFL